MIYKHIDLPNNLNFEKIINYKEQIKYETDDCYDINEIQKNLLEKKSDMVSKFITKNHSKVNNYEHDIYSYNIYILKNLLS
jgi:hypothetical protein